MLGGNERIPQLEYDCAVITLGMEMLAQQVAGNRADSLVLKESVIDLSQGRFRGAVLIRQWKDGCVSSRIRHCPQIRQDPLAAESDARLLACSLRENVELTATPTLAT